MSSEFSSARIALQLLPTIVEKCVSDTREFGETVEQMFVRKAFLLADAFVVANRERELSAGGTRTARPLDQTGQWFVIWSMKRCSWWSEYGFTLEVSDAKIFTKKNLADLVLDDYENVIMLKWKISE